LLLLLILRPLRSTLFPYTTLFRSSLHPGPRSRKTPAKEGSPVANKLQGKRVAFLATDMVEQVELTEPWKAVEDEGAQIELVSLEEGEIHGFNHYDKADTFKVDRTVEEARVDDYD